MEYAVDHPVPHHLLVRNALPVSSWILQVVDHIPHAHCHRTRGSDTGNEKGEDAYHDTSTTKQKCVQDIGASSVTLAILKCLTNSITSLIQNEQNDSECDRKPECPVTKS